MNKKAIGINNEEKILEELDSTKIRSMNKKVVGESSDKGVENTKKIKARSRMKRMSKRQKTDADLDEEGQLKAFLNIFPNEEGEVNYEVLDKRVFRADGSLRYIKTFTKMVSRYDRLHFMELHSLVMQRFETTTLEGIDLVLWGTEFYMLAERRYPLTKETLERMLALRLISEPESKMDMRKFFKCWFHNHTTNGPQFTMSNRHQELASPKQTASELASPKQTAHALAIPEQTATSKETSNLCMAVNLDLSRLATTLNRLERSIQIGINTVRLKTFSRYGYTYLKEIVLRIADYKEYKISKADFKNLCPNDFEDLNNQKKTMRETEVYKFSDGALTRILEKLDHMVKEFRLFKLNPGMEHRIWSKDDKRGSKEFIEVFVELLEILCMSAKFFCISYLLSFLDHCLLQKVTQMEVVTWFAISLSCLVVALRLVGSDLLMLVAYDL
ncbi:hypothetical protein Tco_0283044 [Tanacetum coccineum]